MAALLMGMLLLAAAQPAEALNIGGLTKDVGPQLAQMIADNLGIKVPVDQAMSLLDKGKAVSGSVSDPSKLLNLGVPKAQKGDMFKLLNQGDKKLSITPESGGDGITQDISKIFGPMASMFK